MKKSTFTIYLVLVVVGSMFAGGCGLHNSTGLLETKVHKLPEVAYGAAVMSYDAVAVPMNVAWDFLNETLFGGVTEHTLLPFYNLDWERWENRER